MVENLLETEIEAYMKNLDSMLAHNGGKYVAFKGKEHGGFWVDQGDCLREAYQKYGNVSILLRQVSREYQIYGEYGKPVEIFSSAA